MRAATHLAEMRDLAERILAMGNTLETRETGKPTVAVWDLGRDLAELVQHFNFDDALLHLSTARTALDDPMNLEESVQMFYSHASGFDEEALKGAAIDEIDQAINELYEEPE